MQLSERFSKMHLLVEKKWSHYEKLRVAHTNDMDNFSAKERYDKFYASNNWIFNAARHMDIVSFLWIRGDDCTGLFTAQSLNVSKFISVVIFKLLIFK